MPLTGHAAVETILVTDFGAIPDDGRDDTIAVKSALAEAQKARGPVTVRFAPGQYDFFKHTAEKASYPVTAVHLQWDFATPFHLNGFKNTTIEGSDCTLMMHGRMTPFVLNKCEGVTVRGMTVEHERPSVFELKVLVKNEGSIEYLAAEGDRFVIEKNQLIWLDADDNRQIPGITQEYDPLRDTTWRRGNPLKEAQSITLVGNQLIRVQYPAGSKIYKNIIPGRSFQFRDTIRKQCGAVIFECSDVTFENMHIHSWNGLGFVGQFSRDITLRNLRMEPREASGRTNTGFSDGIQMMNCRGRLLIEGCRIVGLHDDHINIYGQMMRVDSVESPEVIRAVYTSGETEGHINFHPGDSIGFRNPQTLADEGEGEIVQAKLLDNKTMQLRIKGILPKQPTGFWVENRTWIPDDVIIRKNYFGRVPTRSILIYLARRAVIENNRFHRIRMTSILLQTPDQQYALQNSVGSLAVRNNVFFECTGPLIQSNPQVKPLSANAKLYGTLLVEGNLLSMRENKPLFLNLRGFREVKIGKNQIQTTGPDANLARITDCEAVELHPQHLLGIQGKPQVEFIRVKQHVSDTWTIK